MISSVLELRVNIAHIQKYKDGKLGRPCLFRVIRVDFDVCAACPVTG
jgi:hypothetical protein